MGSHVRHLTKCVRAIVFINHVIFYAGCSRTPGALERWGEAFEAAEFGQPPPEESSHKWRRYLKGVLVGPQLRVRLMRRHIGLLFALGDLLWSVLAWLEKPTRDCNQLARVLRINGKPLSHHNRKQFLQVLSGPDWRLLVYMLAILATSDGRYRVERNWLQRHFTVLFLLVCTEPQLAGAEEMLFKVLTAHFRSGRLAPPNYWLTKAAFRAYLESFRGLKKLLGTRLPRTRLQLSTLVCVLMTDPACKAIFEPVRDEKRLLERCCRLVRQRNRIAKQTELELEGFGWHPKVLEGWPRVSIRRTGSRQVYRWPQSGLSAWSA